MDKPTSLSVRFKKSDKVIEAIVNHQFQHMNENLMTIDSFEISGFGRIYFNRKKALLILQKEEEKVTMYTDLLSKDLTLSKRTSVENKLNNTLEEIKMLKHKLKI